MKVFTKIRLARNTAISSEMQNAVFFYLDVTLSITIRSEIRNVIPGTENIL